MSLTTLNQDTSPTYCSTLGAKACTWLLNSLAGPMLELVLTHLDVSKRESCQLSGRMVQATTVSRSSVGGGERN